MVKLLVIIVVVAGVALFLVKGHDGKPFLTIDNFAFILSPEKILPRQFQSEEPADVTKIYRWKDADGIWQFSNSPDDKEGAELVEIDSRINIIQAYSTQATTPPAAKEVSAGESGTPTAIPGVMTVSPEQAAEMMETVKNLQATLAQRKADLDAISGMDK